MAERITMHIGDVEYVALPKWRLDKFISDLNDKSVENVLLKNELATIRNGLKVQDHKKETSHE